MEEKLSYNFENVSISLNYGTVSQCGEDAIYIGTEAKYGFDGDVAITIEEAKWLLEKLPIFINAFSPKNRIDSLIKYIESDNVKSLDTIKEELENISLQLKD